MKFSEKLSAIYRSITSKEDAKPSLFMYETETFYITPKLHLNQVNSEHSIFTHYDKMDDVESVYTTCGITIYTNLMRSATRTELYKVSIKMIKKYFDCDSVEDFYKTICSLKFHNNDIDEEFFNCGDLYLVYSYEEIFIGVGKTELIDTSTEEASILPEDDEPVFNLEFEEDE